MKRILVALALTLLNGCASRPEPTPSLRTVPYVDLQRYMGDWYVIANIPYSAERNKVATIERYELGNKGKIANTFIFRKKTFTAPEQQWHATGTVVNHETNAEWRMQFAWPIKLAYLIIDLDPDYRWAVVGHPSRDYLWVLARERSLNKDVYRNILQRAEAQGFDLSKIMMVSQPK